MVCYFYSMETLNKKKYDFLLHLLETGDAMVCLDARLPEVDVPENQKSNSSLSLIFNLNFRRPFTVNENAISATLAFRGSPHECLIPLEKGWNFQNQKSPTHHQQILWVIDYLLVIKKQAILD